MKKFDLNNPANAGKFPGPVTKPDEPLGHYEKIE
jgi:hypothetical protein